MKILVTGAAGFIGSFVSRRLVDRGDEVVGLDNLNDYYDVELKKARLATLETAENFQFEKLDLADRTSIEALFDAAKFDRVVHLGAQAGVQYSRDNPHAYAESNVTGTLNILEGCRANGPEHLVYASSSSVYGANRLMPYSVHHSAAHPLSLYAATKKANEAMAHAYSSLYEIPVTGLRFFTVYGPFGRPDMVMFRFTQNILAGKPIDVFNYGNHRRDFTYIYDIVEGVIRTLDRIPLPNPNWDPENPDPATSSAPYRLYNIGNNRPVDLMRYIEVLEECLGSKAQMNLLPLQPGDVPDTHADVRDLEADMGYRPTTPVETGVRRFVDWYLDYYGVAK